jgi:hypothetical protein
VHRWCTDVSAVVAAVAVVGVVVVGVFSVAPVGVVVRAAVAGVVLVVVAAAVRFGVVEMRALRGEECAPTREAEHVLGDSCVALLEAELDQHATRVRVRWRCSTDTEC